MGKRVALYLRVSTAEQSPQCQLSDLRTMVEQRHLEIVGEYVDHGVSGARTSRPALDRLLADARRGKFDVLAIWAFDRLARSVAHLIRMLDELGELGIEFVSYREAFDTHGALGRAITVILGAIAELERSIIRERVCAGIRRARRDGRRLGRRPLPLDQAAIVRDYQGGASLRHLAAHYGGSRSTMQRLVAAAVPKSPVPSANSPSPEGLSLLSLPVPECSVSGPAQPSAPAPQKATAAANTSQYCGENQHPKHRDASEMRKKESAEEGRR